MKQINAKTIVAGLCLMISVSLLQSCQQNNSPVASSDSSLDSLKKIAMELVASNDTIASRLKTFDELDFDVFSNQKWDRLKESHAENIKVYWPDGHVAEGINTHIDDLKKLFVHAPDTRIKEHPIRFGNGNYTLVTGVFEGTFTKPMPIGNGKFIQPTGKAFKMPMATVGVWKDGVMIEEHLFWDNQTYAKQIGLQ
ncbi:MAG: ester cyclase [Chitinophagaceae bacterium]